MNKIKTMGLIINVYQQRIIDLAKQLIAYLELKEINVVMLTEEGSVLERCGVSLEQFREMADLVLVIGGDGTVLRAAQCVYGKETPLIGIKQGYLGFLTALEVKELDDNLERLLQGDYQVERRMMLSGEVYRDGKLILQANALNDLVISRSSLSRVLGVETYMDGNLVEHYYGDGVIFSTPTGSTGYSLSAGGPIVSPDMDVCVMTPLCSHLLVNRPIVFGLHHPMMVKFTSEPVSAVLERDGKHALDLQKDDVIYIKRAEYVTCLVTLKEKNFFAVMREKLRKGNQEG